MSVVFPLSWRSVRAKIWDIFNYMPHFYLFFINVKIMLQHTKKTCLIKIMLQIMIPFPKPEQSIIYLITCCKFQFFQNLLGLNDIWTYARPNVTILMQNGTGEEGKRWLHELQSKSHYRIALPLFFFSFLMKLPWSSLLFSSECFPVAYILHVELSPSNMWNKTITLIQLIWLWTLNENSIKKQKRE